MLKLIHQYPAVAVTRYGFFVAEICVGRVNITFCE
jgi:hypothetical protein